MPPAKKQKKEPPAPTIIRLDNDGKDTAGKEPITADLDGWKVVKGKPTMKTWILHTKYRTGVEQMTIA